jgi:hypothetical protein
MRAFEEQAFHRSLEASERRRAAALARRRRQDNRFLGGLAGVVVLAGCLILIAASRRRVPGPPSLSVQWPQYAGVLNFFSDSSERGACRTIGRVLLRPGRPVAVQAHADAAWRLSWRGDNVQAHGEHARWIGSTEATSLTLQCWWPRSGLARAVPRWRPDYCLQLQSVTPQAGPDGRQRLQLQEERGSAVWITPHVAISSPAAAWDEKAVDALERALADVVNAGAQPGATTVMKAALPLPRWLLATSFQGDAQAPVSADVATYLAVLPEDVLKPAFIDTFKTVARALAHRAPQASIKLALRYPNTKNAAAVMRIVFDGKGHHSGWVKECEAAKAKPLVWWRSEE